MSKKKQFFNCRFTQRNKVKRNSSYIQHISDLCQVLMAEKKEEQSRSPFQRSNENRSNENSALWLL